MKNISIKILIPSPSPCAPIALNIHSVHSVPDTLSVVGVLGDVNVCGSGWGGVEGCEVGVGGWRVHLSIYSGAPPVNRPLILSTGGGSGLAPGSDRGTVGQGKLWGFSEGGKACFFIMI